MSHVHLQITDALSRYIREVSQPEPDYLARLREETAAHPRARMQITPEQGQLMGILTRLLNVSRAIEIGVFTGYSSICVASAMGPKGLLIACDVSEEYTSIARRYWADAGVESRIDLRLGPALDTLADLLDAGQAGHFDLAFIDADKSNYLPYYENCLRLLRPGGLLLIDNTLWSGRVADPSVLDADTLALRELNDFLSRDSRVWTALLPVGDGLTVALKR
jgi:predicted O-methyltransferase YrrM